MPNKYYQEGVLAGMLAGGVQANVTNIGYQVTFKVEGNDYYVASCKQGESITEPPIPTMQSGTFGFWRLNGINVAFPFTPNADCTLEAYAIGATLLAHCDDFTDSGTYQLSLTNNGVDIDTSVKKFGTGSWHFVENTDYVSVPNGELTLGTNDFTIDFWLYPTAFTGGIISAWHNTNYCYLLTTTGSAGQLLFACGNGVSSHFGSLNFGNIVLNQWQHIAVTRSGDTLYGFIDGHLSGTYNINAQALGTVNYPLSIGKNNDASAQNDHTTGYIDEIRILNGTCAWTEDFIPPSHPY